MKDIFDNDPRNPVNEPLENTTCLNCNELCGDDIFCCKFCEGEYFG